MEYSVGLMEDPMRVNGRMGNNMEKGFIIIWMV